MYMRGLQCMRRIQVRETCAQQWQASLAESFRLLLHVLLHSVHSTETV